MTNDPYYGGVTHLNDIVLAMPVFSDGKLIAWTADIAHNSDVGGMAPGSLTGDATEIFQEGIRLPAIKVISQGETIQSVMDILIVNSRMPDTIYGDVWAQIAAVRIGAKRLQELAKKYGAKINLRFDDTNPENEDQIYIDAIKEDISWLGYNWDKECYASDYFDTLHDWAVELIKKDKAYVDSQTSVEMAEQKGTPTEPGTESPFRNRPVEESLDLFSKMKNGDFKQGKHVLRAKISMSSSNMLMRDPVIYRALDSHHPRTKDKWKIYPMYDWTHGESDYIEQVTHSLCTLEFKPHRDLYDWFLDIVVDPKKIRPKQREFARLNLSHTITSKRKLLSLVQNNYVSGWDDPRTVSYTHLTLPTILLV